MKGELARNWKGGIARYGDWRKMHYVPEHPNAYNGKYVFDYRLKVEKLLGRYLDTKHPIHHHTQDQIVVCEDEAYHQILERRTRAYNACGHANWRKCFFCQAYDDPENLDKRFRHPKCHAAYNKTNKKGERKCLKRKQDS